METELAVWDDMNCPKCGGYFVAQDKWGLFCVVDGCGWTDADGEPEPKQYPLKIIQV